MFGVRIVALSILAPCPRTVLAVAALGVDFDAATHKWAKKRILGPCGVVAVNGTQVVPERVLGRLQVVLNLDNARWGDIEMWQVTELEGDSGAKGFRVDDVVNGGVGIARDNVALVIVS
jgi:hypothetical protein